RAEPAVPEQMKFSLECGDSFAALVFSPWFWLPSCVSARQTKNQSGEGIAALQTKPKEDADHDETDTESLAFAPDVPPRCGCGRGPALAGGGQPGRPCLRAAPAGGHLHLPGVARPVPVPRAGRPGLPAVAVSEGIAGAAPGLHHHFRAVSSGSRRRA